MSEEEILKGLHESVLDMDKDKATEYAQKALDEGVKPLDAIMDGLLSGMSEVGKLFDAGDYFVPEVLMASEALYAGLDVLKPHINKADLELKGQVVIGVAEGDVHDIGKNLVKMMFDVAGLDIVDLGKDVPLEKFVEESLKTDSDIIAISAMMTSTMLGIPKVVEMAREKAPNAKIICGGAPITEETAADFGADGFAPKATDAVDEALKMIEELKKEIRKKE
ncbi:cobalamin-binding protein [candidate division MSBL1 archaeon SCGC-AAA261F19]|uniref:Cobalamin-binding protein n=1 Tax=candidate division MSBL1 archaeon SCGC-AAA261F19 TaxID=1698275 RepID=A0A133VBV4_9EURY|nr:cobalamin-binding protein [candidate division MSBL1 archaeon SCGC-AAA261F19]